MIVRPWREVEIVLTMERETLNPYVDVEAWVEFTHDSGVTLRRPAFWDGGRTFGVRFASPLAVGRWTWHSYCSVEDAGLAGQSGELVCQPGAPTANRFYRHGFCIFRLQGLLRGCCSSNRPLFGSRLFIPEC